jgi:pyruvate carboxylase
MQRALNEYQISGVISNIQFLKYILDSEEFKTGKYDINFIDNLFKNESNIIFENTDNDSSDSAAIIFATLMKNKKSEAIKHKSSLNFNLWRNQLYD